MNKTKSLGSFQRPDNGSRMNREVHQILLPFSTNVVRRSAEQCSAPTLLELVICS